MAALRDRLVSAPAFHRAVLANPITRPVALHQTRALFDVVSGFVYAQTLFAFTELDVIPKLVQGPVPHADLAQALDLSPDALDVLMNAGAALGLVERRGAGWGLGLKGAALLAQGGVFEMVAHHRHLYGDLADPVALLRGAKDTALSRYWTYAGRPEDGDAAPYTGLMAASQAFVASAILPARVLSRTRLLLDIGGGAGAFVSAALGHHAHLRAVVADLPDVLPLAQSALAASPHAGRTNAIAFDMFADSLPTEPDTLSLVRILHDHDDDAVAKILNRIATQRPDARLIIAEPMADRRRPNGLDAYFPWYFMAMGQGRYRTREAYEAHLRAAGFRTIRTLPSRNPTLVRGLIASVDPH